MSHLLGREFCINVLYFCKNDNDPFFGFLVFRHSIIRGTIASIRGTLYEKINSKLHFCLNYGKNLCKKPTFQSNIKLNIIKLLMCT